MGASDIMTAQVVAVKPGTTAPRVGRGDERFIVAKGAPHVIFELVQDDPKLEERVRDYADELARNGYRTLRTDAGWCWGFLDLPPLFDPPQTVERAST